MICTVCARDVPTWETVASSPSAVPVRRVREVQEGYA